MAIVRNQQQLDQADQAEDTGQAIDAQGQPTSGSELAERHRRTSKHRAPKQSIGPQQTRQIRQKSQQAVKAEQQVLPFRGPLSALSWLSSENISSPLARRGRMVLIGAGVAIILLFVYYYFAGSRFFALRDVDVYGNKLVTADEIKLVVRSVATRGLLRTNLEQVRARLKTNELVKEAVVTRVLPDILSVSITERDPYALVRRSDGSVVCVDSHGNMFGNQSLFRSKQMMPLINGLAEHGDNAAEINRQRLMTYQKLIADLDGAQPPLSSRIDEVVFDDVQGVRVILADSRIAVFLGKEDFRMCLNAALDVLDAIRRKDADALKVLRIGDAEKLMSGARISYLNATTPKRVIVGLDE